MKYEGSEGRYAPFNALVDEDPEGREQVAVLIAEAVRREIAAIIVNNKAEGSAPLTIHKLADRLVQRS